MNWVPENKSRSIAMITTLGAWAMLRLNTAIAAVWVEKFYPAVRELGGPISMQVFEVAFTTHGWLRPWLAPWYRWDTAWYILIAHSGYEVAPEAIAFAPLYPLLIRAVAPVVGWDYLAAALVVSNLAALAALLLLYLLVREDFGNQTARRTAILLVGFPSAFFLVAGYAESLYLALAIGAWLAMRKERYVFSGMLGLLASLARSQGWVLGLVFGFILVYRYGREKDLRVKLGGAVRGLPAVAGPFLGEVIYLSGMEFFGYGNVAQVFSGAYWNVQIQAPWITISQVITKLVQSRFVLFDWINLGAFIFCIVLAAVVFKRMKVEYSIYIWTSIAFALLRGTPTYVLNGFLRYTVSYFPLFIGLALVLGGKKGQKPVWMWLYLFAGWVLQILLVMFFASWIWVS